MEINKTLTIDNDLRIITIPPGVTLLGVENEDDVERLHFRVPRMHNDIDLADFVPRIHYMNAASQGDIAPVEKKTVTDDSISFYWRVRRKVTKYKGKVQFIVCLKKAAEDGTVLQEFNTYPAALPVLRGLEVTEAQPVEGFPDVLEQILLQLDGRVPNTRKINGHALSQDVNLTAADVGADPAGAAGTAVSDHNVATDAHNDLRLLIDGLARRLNAAGDAIAAKAPAIIQTVEGTALTLTDAAEQRLAGLHLFGRSVQNGTPAPDAPVEIKSLENPTVTVDDKNLALPYVLRGIPVASGGNYVDQNGQAWLCDEIDLERGVYVQRVHEKVFTDGAEFAINSIASATGVNAYQYYQVGNGMVRNFGYCTHFRNAGAWANGLETENCVFWLASEKVLVFKTDGVQSLDDFRAFIAAQHEAGTPLTVYYCPAEPIETPLPAVEIAAYKALLANSPTTAIINDADAYMRASYVVDTKTYINSRSGAAPGVTPEQIARAVADYLKENPIDTGAMLTIGTIELFADKWEGGEKLYSQIVEVPGATPYSQVDLTPSVEQLAIFHDKDLSFVTENENGVVTVYAIGQKPTNDYTIQVTIKEVST